MKDKFHLYLINEYWLKQLLCVGFWLCVLSFHGYAQDMQGTVIEVRPQQGEARILLTSPAALSPDGEGEILSRRGSIRFLIRAIQGNEVRVTERRSGTFNAISRGDRAVFYPGRSDTLQKTNRALEKVDQILSQTGTLPPTPLEQAPDFLKDVTGDTLLEYEAWLLELESSPISPVVSPATPEVSLPPKKEIPFYPETRVNQYLRSGADYNRYVYNATMEEGSPRVVEEDVGRFIQWNYKQQTDCWKDSSTEFENTLEANELYLQEEFRYLSRQKTFWGDRYWWENYTQWRNYRNKEGDSFLYDNLEYRYIQKLSDKWDWQMGLELEGKSEYEADWDDGYTRVTGKSEWNYQSGYEKWGEILYEISNETRNEADDSELNYLSQRLETRYNYYGEEWIWDFYAESEYRDYNQPDQLEDELRTDIIASLRRKLDEKWTAGMRLELEPRWYPTTADSNTNAIRVETGPVIEYSSGTTLFINVEPSLARVFHVGKVPDDVFLTEDLPRNKKDGDYCESGVSVSLTWLPNSTWRVSLYEDLTYRWFPAGETGGTAYYLYDFPIIANTLSHFASISIDYLCSDNLDLTFRVSHTRDLYQTYVDNNNSTINTGIELQYRF